MAEIKDKVEKEIKVVEYKPSDKEKELQKFLERRITEMKEYRKSLKVEDEWKEADKEYIPSEIPLSTKKRLEEDQDVGRRSRLVRVSTEEDEWRSNISDPTLLAKIQTAIAIIIDRDPRAILTASAKKFEKRTALRNGLWKRNWKLSGSKQVLKLFAFDLAKYGWGVGRSYPCIIKYPKKILIEYDQENPEKSKYEDKELVWYNDVAKQRLDPYRTWIDEMTKPYNVYSMNDCYYELDYSFNAAAVEFDKYSHFKAIGESAKNEDTENLTEEQKTQREKERKDIITFGFYENRLKDLFIIYVPRKKIVLYNSPLPNDDGLLSIWHSLWLLRNSDSPYGISLWKMIKGKKEIYDKMMNMTMDQLVLSILKMFFYTGTSDLFADGKIRIVPGKGKQIQNGDIKWLEIPGPGNESWEGLKWLKSSIDDDSGITPTIEGEITGKTLGEILHAKEASLKRLKVPVENISWAIEQDGYLTSSWQTQIYSTPEIKTFTDAVDLMKYEEEVGVTHQDLYGKPNPETGEVEEMKATFYPEMSLHLEERSGQLYESKESRYFQIGKDIKLEELEWRGLFEVVPTSILAPSEELEKQRKAEIFNLLVPLLGQPPELVLKPVKQLLKANDEEPEDWLPDSWLVEEKGQQQPLFIDNPALQQAIPPEMMGKQTMQGRAGTMPNQGAPTVVPQQQIQPAAQRGGIIGALKNAFRMK